MATLYMMIGLPGSGKSSYAHELSRKKNAQIFSSDGLRKELFGDEGEQSFNAEVFRVLQGRIRMALKDNKSCVYDATNLSMKRRVEFLKDIESTHCTKVAVVMMTPIEVAKQRNAARDRVVPEKVIDDMLKRFQMPQLFEGFDKILLVYSTDAERKIDPIAVLLDEMHIPHDSSWHKRDVYEHCQEVMRLVSEKGASFEVVAAALLHDLGKPLSKVFVDSKGAPTPGEAHYYGHECVGAYLTALSFGVGVEKNGDKSKWYSKDGASCTVMFNTPVAPMEVVFYINYHMTFKYYGEKKRNEFKKLVGEERYKNLVLLSEMDKKGA